MLDSDDASSSIIARSYYQVVHCRILKLPGVYCSTHRVPSATKRRSLPTSYRSYRYRHRYQYKSLPDYFFIGQRGVDGAAARAINMGRSRTRSRYIRRFFSKARGWLSVCSLLRTHLRSSLSVVSASSSRSLCFRASDAAQVACGGCRI